MLRLNVRAYFDGFFGIFGESIKRPPCLNVDYFCWGGGQTFFGGRGGQIVKEVVAKLVVVVVGVG